MRAILAGLIAIAAGQKVLLIGDSAGSYAGRSLEDFCPGATVINLAVGGTFTGDWTADEIKARYTSVDCEYTHVHSMVCTCRPWMDRASKSARLPSAGVRKDVRWSVNPRVIHASHT